jgi:hypothetical protein
VATFNFRSVFKKRLVFVVRTDLVLDEKALVASIEQNRQFSYACHHVHTMFAFTRRMTGTESPCESYFNHLKYLYTPITGPTTTTLCQQVRCRAAGLRGDGLDDAIIEIIAKPLHERVKHIRSTRKAFDTLRDPKSPHNAERAAQLDDLTRHLHLLPPVFVPHGRREQIAWMRQRRGQYEASTLRDDDRDHLEFHKIHRPCLSLPLHVQNKSQWHKWEEANSKYTKRDKDATHHVQRWAVDRQRSIKKLDAEPVSDSSSLDIDSSADCSDSGNDNATRDVTTAAPPRDSMTPNMGSLLGSSTMPASGVAWESMVSDWVLPPGGL